MYINIILIIYIEYVPHNWTRKAAHFEKQVSYLRMAKRSFGPGMSELWFNINW